MIVVSKKMLEEPSTRKFVADCHHNKSLLIIIIIWFRLQLFHVKYK